MSTTSPNAEMTDTKPEVKKEKDVETNENANVPQKPASPPFSWDAYIAEFGFTTAPKSCFNQSPIPPQNEFEKGRLLVVPDLKGGDMPCLGSIQQVHGPWINIRLEGTDHSDDRWVMCDDSGIAPIKSDSILNPPVGYLHSLRGFHQWKDKQINTLDENGEGRLARPEWFRPIERKHHPSKCHFQVGQKLEAVDPKNFSGVPHIATVVKVNQIQGMLSIHFDGWSSSYDIEEHYTSRNLFPVGWSALVGLEVAAPSMQVLRAHAANPQTSQAPIRGTGKGSQPSARASVTPISHQKPIPAVIVPKRLPPPPIQRLSEIGANPTSRPTLTKVKPLPPKTIPVAKVPFLKKRPVEVKTEENHEPQPKRISAVEPTTRTPSESSSMANLSTASVLGSPVMNGSMGGVSPRPSSTISATSTTNPTTPLPIGKEPPGQQGVPTDVMLSCGDSVPMSQRSMTVFVNRHCRAGNLLNPQRIHELPRVIGPLSIHHVVREVVQQLINCGNEHVLIYRKVEAGPVKILSVTAQVHGFTNVRYIPIVKNVTAAWAYIRKLLQKIGCCPNLIADSPTPCNQCPISPDDVDDGVVTTSAASSSRQRSHNPDALSDASAETSGSGISSQPFAQWTIERVEEELSKHFEPAVVDKFKNNLIDGRALALLKTESIIKHMDIPLGPALRIMDFIEALRGQQPTSTKSETDV